MFDIHFFLIYRLSTLNIKKKKKKKKKIMDRPTPKPFLRSARRATY